MQRKYLAGACVPLLAFAAACGSTGSHDTPAPASTQHTTTVAPTTRPTAAPAPTVTVRPTDTPVTTTTGPKVTVASLSLFFVAEGDASAGAPVGCGDSLVMVETEKVTFVDQVKVTFDRLLSNHSMRYGQSGLYNSLYQSDLTFVKSQKIGDTVLVELAGKLLIGGECDGPRVVAQLKQTAKVAAGTGDADVLINGESVGKLVSTK